MDEIDDSDLDAFIPNEVGAAQDGEHAEEDEDEEDTEDETEEDEDEEAEDDPEEDDEEEKEVEKNSSPRRSSRLNTKKSEEETKDQRSENTILKVQKHAEEEDNIEEIDNDEEGEEEEEGEDEEEGEENEEEEEKRENEEEGVENEEEEDEEDCEEEEKAPLRRSSRLSTAEIVDDGKEGIKEELKQTNEETGDAEDIKMEERQDKSEKEDEEQIISLARQINEGGKEKGKVPNIEEDEDEEVEKGGEKQEEIKMDKDKVVEMDDEEMDDIEDSDLDAFLPKDKTPDQQNKNQASDSESDYEEILDGDDDEEEEEEEVEKIEIKTEVARTREVEVKTKVDNKALVPSKPVEPLNKGTASVETILSQYEELNTVKVAKAEVKKEVEMEDANIKSILARYGPDSLVVGKAKDDPEPILKVVEEENGNPGEEFIEEELQKPSIMEEMEKPKTGNFDFTSLTGLSDDEDEVEADEKIEESTGKEESTAKEEPIPNLELVKMKQEETLAEIAEQVRCGKQKFMQY